jgi:hypothetical protein
MISFQGNGMHHNVNSGHYKMYPKHLQEEMRLIDEQYLIVERLQMADKLPKYPIPDFPLSCAMLYELFFGKNKKIKIYKKSP